ncbi:MAG: type II toxin-antitoxin system PemK/MazF family toxin [Candidatus Rokuibacteriota bacterium]
MRRGEIFWARLSPRSGAEQAGARPVLVVSHDAFNQTPSWASIIVVPLTTSEAQGRRGPTAIPLPAGTAGLKKGSVALCHQVTTLDRAKLTARVGVLPPEVLARIEDGLRAALDLA